MYAPEHKFTYAISKMVEIDVGYVSKRLHCLGDRKKIKHVLAVFGGTSEALPKFFYASAHCGRTLIFLVWGSYNGKTLLQPSKVNAI